MGELQKLTGSWTAYFLTIIHFLCKSYTWIVEGDWLKPAKHHNTGTRWHVERCESQRSLMLFQQDQEQVELTSEIEWTVFCVTHMDRPANNILKAHTHGFLEASTRLLLTHWHSGDSWFGEEREAELMSSLIPLARGPWTWYNCRTTPKPSSGVCMRNSDNGKIMHI